MREYTPFESLMREMMSQFFEDVVRTREQGIGTRVARLPVDVWVTDEAVILEASLPGVQPEDVDVTFDGDTLIINATLPEPQVQGKSVLRERYHGPVHRALTLDIPVDTDRAEAVFRNGVLRLTIPRADKARPHKIQVKSG